MEVEVGIGPHARSLESFGDGTGLSLRRWQIWKQQLLGPILGPLAGPKADRTRKSESLPRSLPLTFSERRGFALGASIERLLVDATERATDYLKHAHPAYSAASVSRLSNCVPLIFWVISIIAAFTTAGAILLSILVVLPTAFRLFIAALPVAKHEDDRPTTCCEPPDDELPIYTIIAPLRDEARVVDQLLSAIESFDYPGIMAQTQAFAP